MRFKKFLIVLIILMLILGNNFCYAISDVTEISSDAAILIDSSSEKILYSKSSKNTQK